MYFPQSKKPSAVIEKAEDSITGKCTSFMLFKPDYIVPVQSTLLRWSEERRR